MNITEIKREPRNQDAIKLLEAVTQQIKDNPDTTEVLLFAKIGDSYHRFSTGIEDLMQLVSVLELAKYDAMHRMGS